MGAAHTGSVFQQPVFQPVSDDDPATVSGHRISALLGAGPRSRTYLAYAPGGQPVALTVFRPEPDGEAEFGARFHRDAQAAGRVRGPFTVPVLGSGREGERYWVASAYVPALSLRAAVAGGGPLPTGVVLRLVAGLAQGLQAVHQAGVVHGGLRPSHVLLAADGPRLKSYGFGWAGEGDEATAFGSPEQAAGKAAVPATDVFALGQIAAYASIGAVPFGDGARVRQAEPDLNELPGQLREIVTRCLIKDPALRPSLPQITTMCAQAAPEQPRHSPWLPAFLRAAILSTIPPPSQSAPSAQRLPPGDTAAGIPSAIPAAAAGSAGPAPSAPPSMASGVPPVPSAMPAPAASAAVGDSAGPAPSAAPSMGSGVPPVPSAMPAPGASAAAPSMGAGGPSGALAGTLAPPAPGMGSGRSAGGYGAVGPWAGRAGEYLRHPGQWPRAPYVHVPVPVPWRHKRTVGVVGVVAGLAVAVTAGIALAGGVDGRSGPQAQSEPAPSVAASPPGGDATGQPEPQPGSVYPGVHLRAGHAVTFHTGPPTLQPGTYSGDFGLTPKADAFTVKARAGTFALLGPQDPATLATCLGTDATQVTTLPLKGLSRGDRLCIRSAGGTTALVTVRQLPALGAPNPAATFDLTVWRTATATPSVSALSAPAAPIRREFRRPSGAKRVQSR